MAIDVTASITCDMCGLSTEVALKESWRSGRDEITPQSVLASAPHWELLSREGCPVFWSSDDLTGIQTRHSA